MFIHIDCSYFRFFPLLQWMWLSIGAPLTHELLRRVDCESNNHNLVTFAFDFTHKSWLWAWTSCWSDRRREKTFKTHDEWIVWKSSIIVKLHFVPRNLITMVGCFGRGLRRQHAQPHNNRRRSSFAEKIEIVAATTMTSEESGNERN